MKIIILAILLSAFVGGKSPVEPPELLPECISDYTLIRQDNNSAYCQEQIPWGDYYLYTCRVQKYSNFHQEYYETIEYVSQCVYTPSLDVPQGETYQIFMPLAANNSTIMSHIP